MKVTLFLRKVSWLLSVPEKIKWIIVEFKVLEMCTLKKRGYTQLCRATGQGQGHQT